MHRPAAGRTLCYDIAMPAQAGQLLFLEGEPSDHVYELRRGIARGLTISHEGERQVTAFFFPGDQIGLPVSECYRFTAEAVTDLHYVRQTRQQWNEALIRSCRDDGRLLAAIGAEQDPVFQRGLIIGRSSIAARVCAFLLSVYPRLPQAGDGTRRLDLPQTDIASYLATSPESVCRQFRKLRDNGLVAMPRRDLIEILDRGGMQALAVCGRALTN